MEGSCTDHRGFVLVSGLVVGGHCPALTMCFGCCQHMWLEWLVYLSSLVRRGLIVAFS
jgi:hypothetical protein